MIPLDALYVTSRQLIMLCSSIASSWLVVFALSISVFSWLITVMRSEYDQPVTEIVIPHSVSRNVLMVHPREAFRSS